MNPEQTGQAYDRIADRWRDDRFNNENGIAAHRRALSLARATGFALNAGCGANTRFNRLLHDSGYEVDGVDVSARMLELARSSDSRTTFHRADLCTWPLPRDYDFITAWDSIWHVPLTQQGALLTKLLGGLAPGGVFLWTAGGLAEPGEHTNTFMGPEVYHATLGIPATLELIADAGCMCMHLEFDQYPEPHVYLIARRHSDSHAQI